MPHLHFHLMDGPDPLTAQGLPCVVRRYERFAGGTWTQVIAGAPKQDECVRVL